MSIAGERSFARRPLGYGPRMWRLATLLSLTVMAACSGSEPPAAGPRSEEPTASESTRANAAEAPEAEEPVAEQAGSEPVPDCDERASAALAPIAATTAAHRGCHWDHECVLVDANTGCAEGCPVAVASTGVVELRAAVAEAAAACEGFDGEGCETERAACGPQTGLCEVGECTAVAVPVDGEEAPPRPVPEVPAHNDASLDGPPPRPVAGAVEAKVRRLFDAIVHDDPARAMDLYFPREAFLLVKAIADPGGYHDRLLRRYVQDIHDLHASTPDLARAEYERFELVRRGGWVAVREEGNRLPYWVSRHSWLHYRVDGQPRRLEVRVLITWDDEWYVTHLNEFH